MFGRQVLPVRAARQHPVRTTCSNPDYNGQSVELSCFLEWEILTLELARSCPR